MNACAFESIDEVQRVTDAWLHDRNRERTHRQILLLAAFPGIA